MFQKILSAIRSDWENYSFFCGYEQQRANPLAFALSEARHYVAAAVCSCVGHAWVDNGEATPDFGNVSMRCSRCDASIYQRLY